MPEHNGPDMLHEKVTFIQHDLPGLEAGAYQLTVSQHVNRSDNTPLSEDTLSDTYTFAVKGDRFSLSDPASVIYSLFPADNASGDFDTVLPHVVFRKTTFPWSRYPSNADPVSATNPGVDTDADLPTWLAVLVLDEDDLSLFPSLKLEAVTATIGDLFPQAIVKESTLAPGNFSYFSKAANAEALDPGETLADAVRVIDLPLPLFWKITPSLQDLHYTAHVRKVSLDNKGTIQGISDQGESVGAFSIVFSNRLPQDGRKSYTFLVSLEGLEDYLPADDGTPPAGYTATDTRCIRLATLQSWVFFSNGQPAKFDDSAMALNRSGTVGTDLCIPYAGSNTLVMNALKMGYVPLNQALRTGEQTVSWYRGPLTPYLVTKERVEVPVSSPDKATIFDPTTGMLDTSYAAAWTLGRLIALQDAGFSTALYNWKQGLTQQVVAAIEDELLVGKI